MCHTAGMASTRSTGRTRALQALLRLPQASAFASWGVDLLKVDGTTADNAADIAAWQTALDRTGRSIWLTVSAWPVPLSLGAAIRQDGQGVRIDTDVDCYCSTISSWTSSVSCAGRISRLVAVPRTGALPDLDSMPISNNTGAASRWPQRRRAPKRHVVLGAGVRPSLGRRGHLFHGRDGAGDSHEPGGDRD